MPDLLLTHGYFLYEDAKEVEIMKPYPPLGLLYLSAYLKREGFDVHRDESWFCTDRCCEYWSWNPSRNDVTEYLERMCFDTTSGRPRLSLLEWKSGGKG